MSLGRLLLCDLKVTSSSNSKSLFANSQGKAAACMINCPRAILASKNIGNIGIWETLFYIVGSVVILYISLWVFKFLLFHKVFIDSL